MSRPSRMTCEQVFRRLDDYLDRALTPEELRRVRTHLRICAACAAEYRFEENLLAEVRSKVQRIRAPAGLMERIVARLTPADPKPDS